MKPTLLPLGGGSLLITSEDFLDGFEAGHLAGTVQVRTQFLSEHFLTTLLHERMRNTEAGTAFNAGYIVGWLVALTSEKRGGTPS